MLAKVQSHREQALPSARLLAESRLRTDFAWGDVPIQVIPAPVGANSAVFFIHPEGGRGVVLRAFSSVKQQAEYVKLGRFIDGRNLPLPALLWCGRRFIDRFRTGYAFAVEEFVSGSMIPRDVPSQEVRAALAVALARLHGEKSKRWGVPHRLKSGPILDDWRRMIAKRLSGLSRARAGLTKSEARGIGDWFRAKLDCVRPPREFHLCHHHLDSSDVIFDATTGRATLVDYESLQFSRAARDLAAIEMSVMRRDRSAREDFLNRFFELQPAGLSEEWREELELFRAFYFLGRLVNHGRDANREWLLALTELGPMPPARASG